MTSEICHKQRKGSELRPQQKKQPYTCLYKDVVANPCTSCCIPPPSFDTLGWSVSVVVKVESFAYQRSVQQSATIPFFAPFSPFFFLFLFPLSVVYSRQRVMWCRHLDVFPPPPPPPQIYGWFTRLHQDHTSSKCQPSMPKNI